MSEKINLTDVKVWIAQNGSHPELLALVEAVAAIPAALDVLGVPIDSQDDPQFRDEMIRAHGAEVADLSRSAARFEFGQDR